MANEKRLIDANALIEEATKAKIRMPHDKAAVFDLIEKAPTVDAVEVVHGRWAALDDDCEELEGEEEAMRWGCTACREIVEYADWTHRSRLTRYCPNCGAKMDGGQDDGSKQQG